MQKLFKFITINYEWNYGKEVIILKSKLTNTVFNEFVSTYQTCSPCNDDTSNPFVYVDPDGGVKLVTNVIDSLGGENEIFALSVANDGFMEFLAFFGA